MTVPTRESLRAPGTTTAVESAIATPGRSLDDATRERMEGRLGHDFGRVRVHTGARAEESAAAVGAHAYTVGRHVVFGHSRFAPGSQAGDELLAHELTHSVQQRLADPSGELRLAGPGAGAEAEARANGPGEMTAAPVGVARQAAPAGAPVAAPERKPEQQADAGAAREYAQAVRTFAHEKSEFQVEQAHQRVLVTSRAVAEGATAYSKLAKESDRTAQQDKVHGLERELAVALEQGIGAYERYLRELRTRAASGEPVEAELASRSRELDEHRADLATMRGIFAPERARAFAKPYEIAMPGRYCMKRAYEGLGKLFDKSQVDEVEKAVAEKDKKSKKDLDQFITVVDTAREKGMAGPKQRAAWRKKRKAWSPTLEELVRPRVSTKAPGHYFFGLALAEAYHSVIVAVNTWGPSPVTLWCDQGGCEKVTGTLDAFALAKAEDFGISYGDWDTYIWQLVPPPEASAVPEKKASP
jgi:uncharacterized protein DUF4157